MTCTPIVNPSLISSPPVEHGQKQPRRPRAVVEDAVERGYGSVGPFVGDRAAGVRVRVEAREVARRYVEADAVAGTEQVGRRADLDPDLLHPAGLQRFGIRERVA